MEELEQAELALLGAAINSAGRGLEDLDFEPTDFKHPVLEQAWRTIQRMKRDGSPVDGVTLSHELRNSGTSIDPTLVPRACEAAPSGASAAHYASIVTEHAVRRRLGQAGRAIAEMANAPGDIEAIIEDARRKLDTSGKVGQSAPVEFVWETMRQTVDNFADGTTSIPTPWRDLNEIIGGLRPGALYTVGARPGVGKSVVGVQLGLALAQHGGVAMLSLEMSQDDVNKRILAHQCHIPMDRLMEPANLTELDYRKIAEWSANTRIPFAVDKSPQVTITQIRRFSRNVHRRAPLAGIVVDYLQLMAQAPSDKRGRQEFVADMSRGLKLLAMEMQVPVIMLSQLNRQSEGRKDNMPTLSDLRESGAIEQDSDVVLLLHRDIVDPGKAHQLDMIIAKNRHGRPGGIELDFAGHYSEIRDR